MESMIITRVVDGAEAHRIHTARCSVWAGLVVELVKSEVCVKGRRGWSF